MTVPARIEDDLQACTQPPDMRNKDRFALLIRGAKLKCNLGEFLCIVRDVSEGGVKLRLFHPIPELGGPLLLELSSGEGFAVEQVWQKDGLAGFRFSDPVDIPRFISEASPYPKRSLRLKVDCPAVIRIDGIAWPARLRDLSREGIRIETDRGLALEQQVVLEADCLPARRATVRWRESPVYGLSLQNILTFEELARTAALMQLPPELLGGLAPAAEFRPRG